MNASISSPGLSEEGMHIFRMLSDKLDRMVWMIDAKENRIQKLEDENALLLAKLSRVEDRLEEMESGERRNNIIISGSSLPVVTPGEITSQVAADVLKNIFRSEIVLSDIVKAFRL